MVQEERGRRRKKIAVNWKIEKLPCGMNRKMVSVCSMAEQAGEKSYLSAQSFVIIYHVWERVGIERGVGYQLSGI